MVRALGAMAALVLWRSLPFLGTVPPENLYNFDSVHGRAQHPAKALEGAIDFGPVLAALRDVGYGGWVTVELYTCHENPDFAAKTARERVLKIAESVGAKF